MTPEEISKLPVLENWYMLGGNPTLYPGEPIGYDPRITQCMFCGDVYNHYEIADGVTLSTGRFERFVGANVFATDRGYFYRLGKVNKILKKKCPNIEELMLRFAEELPKEENLPDVKLIMSSDGSKGVLVENYKPKDMPK